MSVLHGGLGKRTDRGRFPRGTWARRGRGRPSEAGGWTSRWGRALAATPATPSPSPPTTTGGYSVRGAHSVNTRRGTHSVNTHRSTHSGVMLLPLWSLSCSQHLRWWGLWWHWRSVLPCPQPAAAHCNEIVAQDRLRTGSGQTEDRGWRQTQDRLRTGSGQAQDRLRTDWGQTEDRGWRQTQDRLRTGSGQTQDRLRTGSGQTQDRLRTGSGQTQDRLRGQRLRTNSRQAQDRLRTDSGQGQKWYRARSMQAQSWLKTGWG